MTRMERSRLLLLLALGVGAVLMPRAAVGQAPAAPKYPNYPSETPATVKASDASFDYVRRDVMIPMRDGVKLHTVILVPKGAKGAPILLTRTPYDADGADDARREPAPRADAVRLRQRHRRHRRGRLHPRRPGRARQVRLGGRLRHEPAPPRAAEPDARRPRHRHVRHDRLAREERPRVQRQGRDPRHLLRRVHAADGAHQSAPGAQGLGPDEPDGRRLDGRRLVPQRRVPPAGHVLHLRAGSHAQERRQVVARPLRRLRHVPGRRSRRASSASGTDSSRSVSGARSSSTRATTPSGAIRPWTRSSPASR